jgi:hypothetical protein
MLMHGLRARIGILHLAEVGGRKGLLYNCTSAGNNPIMNSYVQPTQRYHTFYKKGISPSILPVVFSGVEIMFSEPSTSLYGLRLQLGGIPTDHCTILGEKC